MKTTFLKGTLLGLGLALGAAQYAAAADTTINLNTGGTFTNIHQNNDVLTYSIAGGHTLKITAWYDTSSSSNFVQTDLEQFSPGLGVCDPSDIVGGACSAPQHEVDNNGGKIDWVLFAFDTTVNFKSLVLDPVGSTHDTDATYLFGSLFNSGSFDLSGSTLTGLGSGTDSLDNNTGSSHVVRTITFSNTTGSYLLIGAKLGSTDGSDYFKIKSITFDPGVVPEPVTWMMMILGFAGLAMARRRSQVRA